MAFDGGGGGGGWGAAFQEKGKLPALISDNVFKWKWGKKQSQNGNNMDCYFLEGNSFKGRGGEGEVGSAPPPFFSSQLLEWAFILKRSL